MGSQHRWPCWLFWQPPKSTFACGNKVLFYSVLFYWLMERIFYKPISHHTTAWREYKNSWQVTNLEERFSCCKRLFLHSSADAPKLMLKSSQSRGHRHFHDKYRAHCVIFCLSYRLQSWRWVTFYDPWPTWPINQLTRDPRDSWPMTHDYSPVTVTVWRLRILGKEVSMRFRLHTVLTQVHNKFSSHQLIFLPWNVNRTWAFPVRFRRCLHVSGHAVTEIVKITVSIAVAGFPWIRKSRGIPDE